MIKDQADRNLLIHCLNSGILQDFFMQTSCDGFFTTRCKNKLVKDYSISEFAAEKAMSYCLFLTKKEREINVNLQRHSIQRFNIKLRTLLQHFFSRFKTNHTSWFIVAVLLIIASVVTVFYMSDLTVSQLIKKLYHLLIRILTFLRKI